MLVAVSVGIRLGTSVFLPGAATGWNDTADGANWSRTSACVTCLVTVGGLRVDVPPVAPLWHLKQTSYSNCDRGTSAPARLMPATAPRFGGMFGADAVPTPIVCEPWQSLQFDWLLTTFVGSIGPGRSWLLILRKSASTFCPCCCSIPAPATWPAWQRAQASRTVAPRSRKAPLGAVCGWWQLLQFACAATSVCS